MRILVTGVCGSLMRAVVPRLLERGYTVRGVDNFMRYGRQAAPEGIEFVEGDLTDGDTVRRALHGMDGVIQAAAQIYGVAGFHRYPADILQRDTLLHGLILRESLGTSIQRVVYISSSMVYERLPYRGPGRSPGDPLGIAREEDVPNMQIPSTDYGLSKLMGERLSRAFAAQYGLAYTIWRPFNIVGPHERAEGVDPGISHVFADFIQRIVREHQNPMLVLGSGQQIRCFTWIEDVAEAIARHSFDPVTRNDDFNLGNPEPVTMVDLAQRIYRIYHELRGQTPFRGPERTTAGRALLGDPLRIPLTFTHAPSFADDVQVRIPSSEKAARVLGWYPRIPLDEMLRRCIAHEMALTDAMA